MSNDRTIDKATAQSALALLGELSKDWEVIIDGEGDSFTLTIDGRFCGGPEEWGTRGSHSYTGTDLATLIRRAHAGEPGDI